jgi:hypothetical protein
MSTNDGQDLGDPGDYSMTPEAASARLVEMTAQYHGVPTGTPTNASEARARLQVLANDSKWYDAYVRGSQQHRAEFDQLTRLVAAADDGTQVGPINVEWIDGVTDPSALPRAARASLMDGLREQGLPPSAELYMNQIDSGEQTVRPTEGDGAACRQALERLMRDPAWCKKVLDGDLQANNTMTALNRVIAYAADDGHPITAEVEQQLAKLMR